MYRHPTWLAAVPPLPLPFTGCGRRVYFAFLYTSARVRLSLNYCNGEVYGPNSEDYKKALGSVDEPKVQPCALEYSKHILNAQVAIRSPCCRKWFDCAECHAEQETHVLQKSVDMTFACKKCKKCFRKSGDEFEDADEYCPHCDNHYVLEAKTPQARLEVEGDDVRKDARMIRDERVKQEEMRTIFDVKDAPNKLG